MTKAVALLSGGLDSTLAVKLMIDQGIEVHALNFTSAFCTCEAGSKNKMAGCKGAAASVAEEFGIPIKVLVKGDDYIEIVRHPKHGYGKGINPCVDCRIYMFKLAGEYMEEIGADFVITGEVLGQRPMSQRRDTFKIIDDSSGLTGRVLRPLCARQLKPTEAEKAGIVDREKLLDMVGRTRRPQMELAEELDVNDYPCPSGGCLLTDKIFSKKVKDLLDHKDPVTTKDLQALKVGRHFRLGGVKIVVSRNESENTKIESLCQPGETLLEPIDFPGPTALVSDDSPNGALETAGRLILRYTSKVKTGSEVTIKTTCDGRDSEIKVKDPMDDAEIEKVRVC